MKTEVQLAEYVRQMADVMGLGNWIVKISTEPSKEGTWAEIVIEPESNLFTLRVSHDFYTARDRRGQRESITHELLHVIFSRARDVVRLDLVQPLSQSTFGIIQNSFQRQMEIAIEMTTQLLMSSLPLPPP